MVIVQHRVNKIELQRRRLQSFLKLKENTGNFFFLVSNSGTQRFIIKLKTESKLRTQSTVKKNNRIEVEVEVEVKKEKPWKLSRVS